MRAARIVISGLNRYTIRLYIDQRTKRKKNFFRVLVVMIKKIEADSRPSSKDNNAKKDDDRS